MKTKSTPDSTEWIIPIHICLKKEDVTFIVHVFLFSVNFEGSDKGSIGMDENSCSGFDLNEDSNLTSINDGNNDDNEADNSYISNEDDENEDNEIDDDENDEENNEDDGGEEDAQNGFEGDESNLAPSLAR